MSETYYRVGDTVYRLTGDSRRAEHASGSATYPAHDLAKRGPASQADIDAFQAERKRVEDDRRRCEDEEDRLLALSDLTRGDFCRLRDVFLEGGKLYVSTRENGVDARSVGAIRNANYITSHPDEGDRTYEWYEFRIKVE